ALSSHAYRCQYLHRPQVCTQRTLAGHPQGKVGRIKGLPIMWKKRREVQARRVIGAWEIRKVMEKRWPRVRR
ncbi:MAG: hypothetical protein ACRET7_04365, partial [Burkholderiales bacterium]